MNRHLPTPLSSELIYLRLKPSVTMLKGDMARVK